MRRRHVPAVLCSLALTLSCNAELDTGLGQGNGSGDGACECTAPQTCSKAGPTCIEPGTCAGDLDCDAGKMCAAGVDGRKTCVVGGKCGGQVAAAEVIPPNMLIVLDRSCSMRNTVAGKSKWEIAVAALKTLTTSYKDKIRFGLTLFPDKEGDSCTQANKIPIPVGVGKEAGIQSMLTMALDSKDALYPSGPCVTNIDTAMDQARGEPAFSDASRQGFALLVTDGAQAGCNQAGGDNGTAMIINDLRMKKGVRTFVIGFGGAVDEKSLNDFAMAGGTTSFYKAEDQASLDKGLATIAASTLGCDFQLKQTPPNGQQIYVFFDKMTRVSRDPGHKDGWDYNEAQNRVTFYGMACDSLRAGTVKAVDIVFGCDAPPPG